MAHALDPVGGPEGRGDQRRSTRRPVVLRAKCRSFTGFVDHVVISDIGTGGCRIDSGALIFRQGQRLLVKPEGIEGLCGQIRWVDGHSAGIAFEQPLYGPVAAYLQRRHAHFLVRPGDAAAGGAGLRFAA